MGHTYKELQGQTLVGPRVEVVQIVVNVLTVLTALDSWSFVVSRDLLSAGRPVTCEPWHVFITPSDEEQDLSDGESDSEGGAIVQRRSDDAEAALGV